MVKHPEVWRIDKRPDKHSPANTLVRGAVTVKGKKHIFFVLFIQFSLAYF